MTHGSYSYNLLGMADTITDVYPLVITIEGRFVSLHGVYTSVEGAHRAAAAYAYERWADGFNNPHTDGPWCNEPAYPHTRDEQTEFIDAWIAAHPEQVCALYFDDPGIVDGDSYSIETVPLETGPTGAGGAQ